MNALTFYDPRLLPSGTRLLALRPGELPRSDRRRLDGPFREAARPRRRNRAGVATQNGRPPRPSHLLWGAILLLVGVGIASLTGCSELEAFTSPCCGACQPTLAPIEERTLTEGVQMRPVHSLGRERSILVRTEEAPACH